MRAGLAVVALSFALTSPGWATDLVNKDNETYQIAVSFGAGVVKTSIAGKTVKIGVCPSRAVKCVVSVEGVGEIEVTGADDVLIQNRRLSKK